MFAFVKEKMGVRLRLRNEQEQEQEQEQMFMYLMMSTCIYGGLGVQNPTAGSRLPVRKPTRHHQTRSRNQIYPSTLCLDRQAVMDHGILTDDSYIG